MMDRSYFMDHMILGRNHTNNFYLTMVHIDFLKLLRVIIISVKETSHTNIENKFIENITITWYGNQRAVKEPETYSIGGTEPVSAPNHFYTQAGEVVTHTDSSVSDLTVPQNALLASFDSFTDNTKLNLQNNQNILFSNSDEKDNLYIWNNELRFPSDSSDNFGQNIMKYQIILKV